MSSPADHVPSPVFWDAPLAADPASIRTCGLCLALVLEINTEAHAAYHRDLPGAVEATLRAAARYAAGISPRRHP